jgi:cysteine-rich repeat protein
LGNGKIDAGETCEDGNQAAKGGFLSCTTESGYSCDNSTFAVEMRRHRRMQAGERRLRRQGDLHQYGRLCGEGLDCLTDIDGNDQFYECTQYCSTSAHDSCPQGQACYALDQVFPTAPSDWGICVLE